MGCSTSIERMESSPGASSAVSLTTWTSFTNLWKVRDSVTRNELLKVSQSDPRLIKPEAAAKGLVTPSHAFLCAESVCILEPRLQ
jgi:hypothetical protein